MLISIILLNVGVHPIVIFSVDRLIVCRVRGPWQMVAMVSVVGVNYNSVTYDIYVKSFTHFLVTHFGGWAFSLYL